MPFQSSSRRAIIPTRVEAEELASSKSTFLNYSRETKINNAAIHFDIASEGSTTRGWGIKRKQNRRACIHAAWRRAAPIYDTVRLWQLCLPRFKRSSVITPWRSSLLNADVAGVTYVDGWLPCREPGWSGLRGSQKHQAAVPDAADTPRALLFSRFTDLRSPPGLSAGLSALCPLTWS